MGAWRRVQASIFGIVAPTLFAQGGVVADRMGCRAPAYERDKDEHRGETCLASLTVVDLVD